MNISKISIKIGIVEFSAEGDQEWVGDQLEKILLKIPELLEIEITSPNNGSLVPSYDQGKNGSGGRGGLSLSVTNIAAKLKCKSGPDLAIAAAAFLKLVQGKASFSREELLKSMKDATGYYKSTFRSNLTNTLVGLVKSNTLTQTAENTYSIQIDKENELNEILSK